jgi:hypothetical protein
MGLNLSPSFNTTLDMRPIEARILFSPKRFANESFLDVQGWCRRVSWQFPAGDCAFAPPTTAAWLGRLGLSADVLGEPHREPAAPLPTPPRARLNWRADVGFGLMTGPPVDGATAADACARGELLACATLTWMASPYTVDTLALVDCTPLCLRGAPRAVNTTDVPAVECAVHEQRLLIDRHSRHAPYLYRQPGWLEAHAPRAAAGHTARADQPRAGSTIHLRCFWGLLRTRTGALNAHHNVRKGAALFAAMLHVLPPKRYYLKLDTDTLLFPKPLLRFLQLLDAATAPRSRLYFGNSNFMVPYAATSRLRTSPAWAQLAAEIDAGWASADGRRVARATSVQYARGPVEGLSHAALSALTRSDCMARVASVECGHHEPAGCGAWSVEFEDAALGLCMFLLRAYVLRTRTAGRKHAATRSDKGPPHEPYTSRTVHHIGAHAVPMPRVLSRRCIHV